MTRPVARKTDSTGCPLVNPNGSPHQGGPIQGPGALTVDIGGLPAALSGDLALCKGPPDSVRGTSTGVEIEGRPAVCKGDPTAHGGVVIGGCDSVVIGR